MAACVTDPFSVCGVVIVIVAGTVKYVLGEKVSTSVEE